VLAHIKSANSLGVDEKENNYFSRNFFCRKFSLTCFMGNIGLIFEHRRSTSVQNFYENLSIFFSY
jgi:hypothetical protein